LKVTIGIPAFNEEKNIAKMIVKLKKIYDEIIVCNDGSTDLTGEIAENLGVIVINHKQNLGYGAGINSIIKKSKEIDTDILVTFDADGQHKVEDVKKVIEPIKNGDADLVIGSRFLSKTKEKIPGYRKIGINIITKVTNAGLKKKITDSQSGFRAYSKDLISKLDISDMGMGISTEILIKTNSLGFRIAEIPITILYEGKTSTQNPISHGTSVLFSTIKYTSIEHPLKFYGIPSLIFFVIGLSFTFLSIDYYMEVGRINPNVTIVAAGTTAIAVILLVASVLFYSLATIVEGNKSK
jgi:glycosyltransferase involved in cell wall biosynthesis|tara:strand:+ start:912 stop:1799 length:888 start_codon:yes stop_codon:yes gene_type:complete